VLLEILQNWKVHGKHYVLLQAKNMASLHLLEMIRCTKMQMLLLFMLKFAAT